MKKFIAMSSIALAGIIISCQPENLAPENEISQDVLGSIAGMGFSTENVQRLDGGYLVEGDIILHDHDLTGGAKHGKLRIAEVEQYRTFNLVNGLPRTITVSVSGSVTTAFSTSVNNAIARYNAENLSISFQRVSTGGDINIRIVNTNQYIASAGFPTNGDPYPSISYAKRYTTGYSDGFMTTVLAHEMGHAIGFRHTDYMNRSYSCGTGGNEGQETTGVGAVNIPGTPTGPDAASWMLACAGASTNRPFNSNDRVALNYLY